MTIMCVNIGSSVGGMTMQWLTGYLFQYYGPTSFVHVVAVTSAALCLIVVVMHLVARRRGERYLASNHPATAVGSSTVQLSKYDETKVTSISTF